MEEDNIAPQNSNPPPLSHHQTHATSQYYVSNQKSENPNPEPNSHLPVEPLNKTHDPVSGIDQGLRSPGVDPNSSAVSLAHSHGGVHEASDPNAFTYMQPEYYQDPNVANALKNWAMEVLRYYGSTPITTGVTIPSIPSNAKKRANQIKVIQSARCEVCMIECNTQEVLDNHKAGKKHKKNMEKLKHTITPPSPVASAGSVNPVIGPPENPATSAVHENRIEADLSEDLETKRRKIMEEGAVPDAVRVCTICNVVCNSELVFACHKAGKKHTSMAAKQREAALSVTGVANAAATAAS